MMTTVGATVLERQAAWALLIAYGLSIVYELWRATAKAGTSRHDSMRTLLSQIMPLYLLATIVIVLLFAGVTGSAWIGLAFSVVFILVSIVYYNPRILPERRPGIIDWFEDLTYTGLLFVAAALLLYEVLGTSLGPRDPRRRPPSSTSDVAIGCAHVGRALRGDRPPRTLLVAIRPVGPCASTGSLRQPR
jgi:hypothetical protein